MGLSKDEIETLIEVERDKSIKRMTKIGVVLLGLLLMPKIWLKGIWEALSFPIFGIPLWELIILGLFFLLVRRVWRRR